MGGFQLTERSQMIYILVWVYTDLIKSFRHHKRGNVVVGSRQFIKDSVSATHKVNYLSIVSSKFFQFAQISQLYLSVLVETDLKFF